MAESFGVGAGVSLMVTNEAAQIAASAPQLQNYHPGKFPPISDIASVRLRACGVALWRLGRRIARGPEPFDHR
jgi:hypothetical protein